MVIVSLSGITFVTRAGARRARGELANGWARLAVISTSVAA